MDNRALFSPLQLGTITLKNRVVMGSMHTGLEEDKSLDRLAAFYRERVEGGVGLIVTGGFSPNRAGRLAPCAATMMTRRDVQRHRVVTSTVHAAGGRIALQILHAGRYGFHPWIVAPSRIKSPISPFTPWKMSRRRIQKTIAHFVRCASLAQEAGYDGIEIMGSEGYLINQFLVTRTNHRTDDWGGDFEHRMRFPVAIIRAIREAVGPQFIMIYRLSMIDLIDDGSSWEEVVQLAQAIEAAGATLINTGIGWHEARVPTIATMVPPAAFAPVTQQLKPYVNIPLITSNRINTPFLANQLLEEGYADLISMARPFLADPDFVNKAFQGEADAINVCIACNQACLDRVFVNKTASCLVNPRACHETLLTYTPATRMKTIAVVGGGPAGLAFAAVAAERGHQVTLFEQQSLLGGQFNLAKHIPGKAEFQKSIDYFEYQLKKHGVTVHLQHAPVLEELQAYDEIVLSTGVIPRIPEIPGIDHPMVMTYLDVLQKKRLPGTRVAVLGAGGIGFDVAAWLVESEEQPTKKFYESWGIDIHVRERGGVVQARPPLLAREVYLLQRKKEKMGKRLGKTTGWIHRMGLKHHRVKMMSGVVYERIDDEGLHLQYEGSPMILAVDSIVICTGQIELRALLQPLQEAGLSVHLIGGADKARELDARHAIHQACHLAASL